MANANDPLPNHLQASDWYQQAKFGLFIHWGAYSAAGVEASWPIMAPDLSEAMFGTKTRITEDDYTSLPAKFNPIDFDADNWVRTAQEAGMRYIIFTSKHHDGFCMFDAPGTDYKITNTPFGRDICLELSQACAKYNMHLGFYYSPPDMHHPGYRDTRKPATKNWLGEPKRKEWASYLDYMESHIRKLLTDYGQVSIVWFDGLANHGKYDPDRFHQLIRSLSPDTLINDRLGDDYDFVTPEQFIPKLGIPIRTGKPPAGVDPGGDGFFRLVTSLFKVPGLRGWIRKQLKKYNDGTLALTPVLQEPYPSPQRFQPWETCMTMGQSWGYNPQETDWKAPGRLVRNLIEVVSRGGNYLLNVGPTERGTFPPEAIERLQYISKWMQKNGESVYGSSYTPVQGVDWGRATLKDDRIHLHVFDWPSTGKLEIPTFPVTANKISLQSGEPLTFIQNGQQLEVSLPNQAPDEDVSVLVIDTSDNKALEVYSPEKETRTSTFQYIKKQAIANIVINSILNGLIAFFTYRLRGPIPYAEAAIDILITVFIIAYLISWLSIGGTHTEIIKGNLPAPVKGWPGLKLPRGAGLSILYITMVCVILFGGLFMDVLLYLLAPGGMSNWAYIGLKTLYTGLCAGMASSLTIQSVVRTKRAK
ncbi:MAG: alpha-L-fucosidase [Chloroflexota bacterium]